MRMLKKVPKSFHVLLGLVVVQLIMTPNDFDSLLLLAAALGSNSVQRLAYIVSKITKI